MKIYYKVKIGFDGDDFISIDEAELQKAIRAQIQGGIVVFKNGSVSGNNIISITPDWNRSLGLKRGYKLQGEDYDQIGIDMTHEASLAIENAKQDILGPGSKQVGDRHTGLIQIDKKNG